ncbi:MAG: hypothetical protein LIP18_07025 [Planctomycetes bacterium]|nr:hypothetical protein [Planctomycetota bacterium]
MSFHAFRQDPAVGTIPVVIAYTFFIEAAPFIQVRAGVISRVLHTSGKKCLSLVEPVGGVDEIPFGMLAVSENVSLLPGLLRPRGRFSAADRSGPEEKEHQQEKEQERRINVFALGQCEHVFLSPFLQQSRFLLFLE